MRYRWAVLAAGTTAAASSAVFGIGLPFILPQLREELDLSLSEIGVVLAASWVGTTLTLFPWGLAADRYGERLVLTAGLLGSALFLVGASFASSYGEIVVALGLVGAAGAAVNSASGRAVMQWFGAEERGFALGVRQTAIPLGGFIGALSLPSIADAAGTDAAFLFLAALSAIGALVGALVLRGREAPDGIVASSIRGDDRGRQALAAVARQQPLPVRPDRGAGVRCSLPRRRARISGRSAALVFAGSQVLGGAFRIGGGRWSDRIGARIVPLRLVGLGIVGVMTLTAVLAGGPTWLLVPVLVLAGGLTMAWNGLSFTAAAELAGALRSGATIGIQQTVLAALGVAGPVFFAATVSSGSWSFAFVVAAVISLVGWWVLGIAQ